MVLKFCLSQFVMEVNLYMEYQKNLRISNLFCVDLTWNYPIISFVSFLTNRIIAGICNAHAHNVTFELKACAWTSALD